MKMKIVYVGAFLQTMLVCAAIQDFNDFRNIGKALNPGGSYSWSEVTIESGRSSPTKIEGRADVKGVTAVSIVLTNRTIEGYLLGNKAYVTCAQKNWKSEPLLGKGESPGALMTRLIRSATPPAEEIELLLNNGQKLKKNGDVISGDLPESTAKKLLENAEKRARKIDLADRNGGRKEAKAVRANVTLWTKDNVVTKYEVRLTGKIDIDGKETEVVRTRTIEIKDIGTTKVDVPEKARQKLGL
jgi:hypothetical protein